MPVTSAWVGGCTPNGALVAAKISGSQVRLAVSLSADMSAAVFFGAAQPDAHGMVRIRATGLDPDTEYFFALEVDDVIDTQFPGRFRTFPPVGEAASFTFAAASCAGLNAQTPGVDGALRPDLLSNSPVFDTIRTHDPLFFAHLGDMHYYNPGEIVGSSADDYRRAWDDVLLQPRQHQLYREVPLVYIWDDHDYGPNNSDSTSPGRAAVQQVYREKVPSYALAEGDAIYHSFQIGRVLFIASDVRSYRTPNSEPDGSNKTMLGSAQKSWMRNLLSTSDAAALVWLNQSPWIETGRSDMWADFATERQELADMFVELGWADRMIVISGDTHAIGFDSGENNPYGGFPVYQCAPMDCSTMAKAAPYDVGFSSTPRQYGRFVVADDGATVTIEAQAYRDFERLFTHHIRIGIGTSAPPPVSEARVRTRVTWLGCDFVTGRIIAELPDVTGSVSRVLGAYTSAGLRLPIPLAGPGALGRSAIQATQPGRTMIVAVVNDIPAWGGIVVRRKGGTEATLELSTVTLEGYLDRRYVRNHTWTQVDEASVIAAGLVGDARTEGIGLIVDAPPTGTLRDRTYAGSDDATVYRRLEELMAVEGGPEWTIDLDWADESQTVVAKIFRVRKRIGRSAAQPTAVFETTAHSVFSSRGASQAHYAYSEDYSDGRGANHILAVSSGEGEDRPISAPARAEDLIASGWPRYESRISPSTSIKATQVLDAHARAELALRKFGSRTWTITTRWDAFPRYGMDWRLGDDVAWNLTGHRHPDGVMGQGRIIGFDLDMQAGTLQPILWEPEA